MASRFFGIPRGYDDYTITVATSDADLDRGQLVKLDGSNEAVAVGADEQDDDIFGVVESVTKGDPEAATPDVTEVSVYFGPFLKMPVPASHHMPSFGDPVYAAAKDGASGDGGGVAASAAAIGIALRTDGSAGSGYVFFRTFFGLFANKPADSS